MLLSASPTAAPQRARLVPSIAAIGASLFIQNAFRGFFGPQPYGYPKPQVLAGNISVFGIPMTRVQLLVLIVSVVSMLALQVFVVRTTTGRSMRAVAQDAEIASLMGIDVNRVVAITFAIGGILAGSRDPLRAHVRAGAVHDGFPAGIAAFTAAVLGGIGSIGGAALGGLLDRARSEASDLRRSSRGSASRASSRSATRSCSWSWWWSSPFRPGGLLGTGEAEKV